MDELDGAPAFFTGASQGIGEEIAVETDVTDEDSVAASNAETVETFGGLDILFNNAGIEGQPRGRKLSTPRSSPR